MKLDFTDAELRFRDELRTIFQTEIPQEIRDRHAAGKSIYPDDTVTTTRIMNRHGLAVPAWPTEWGGQDWTPVQHHIYREEMVLNSVPEMLVFNAGMVGPVIAHFGSPELKERFLPATANLDIWWCQGFSEPEAGSDLASLKTRAVRDGDHYIVNGQKTWTTLGQYADWIFCLVRTDPDAPKKQAGISFLLFPVDTPGVEMRPIQLIDGSYEVNEVFFNDVKVPVENLVGQENDGWTIAKFLLGNERSGIAGVAQTKLKLSQAKQLAADTATADGPLLDDPLFGARLAELEAELLALELTQLRVVASSADGKPSPASSMLKMRGSELQQEARELLTDIAGPASIPVAALDPAAPNGSADILTPEWAQDSVPEYLNFRKVTIYGGSSEVQRGIIAKAVLGL